MSRGFLHNHSACFLIAACVFVSTVSGLPGATHLVTTGVDDFQNPPAGSLRHAIEVLAQPGDTVKFASPIVVTQVDKFVIRAELTGLRVEGPGQIVFKPIGNFVRGVLSVEANNVTLSKLKFKRVHVTALGFDGGSRIAGLTVTGCEFATRGSLALLFTQGAKIEKNNFFLTENLKQEPAISLGQTDDTLVANNTIEARRTNGLEANLGPNLVVRDNASDAPFSITLVSGRVTGNAVKRRSLTVYQEQQAGPIVIEDNTCSMLRVTGVDLSVRRNTIQADRLRQTNYELPVNVTVDEDVTPNVALGVYVGLLNGQDPYDGPVFVEDNVIKGGRTGLQFVQRVATPKTSIARNQIRDASQQGLALIAAAAAKVVDNLVENCTGEAPGTRSGIAVHAGTMDLLIQSNDLVGNHCNGITIYPGATAKVKGNTIENGTHSGIVISEGGNIVAENNTIKACKIGGVYLDPSSQATLTGNTIRKTDGPGIVVSSGASLTATDAVVEENDGPGVIFRKLSRGVLTRCTIRNNSGAGVSVVGGATAHFTAGSFSTNGGPGIDIAPSEVSANNVAKSANGDMDFPEELEFDAAARLVRGVAEPGAAVELFRVETGERLGNPDHGEGVAFLGATSAAGDGTFAISPGTVQEGDLLCLTATRPGAQPVTSEFSENIVVPATVPIVRVNVSSDEVEANGVSVENSVPRNLSDNGRFVVFSSTATNLVGNDSNDGIDVFVRDVISGTTERASVTSSEEQTTGTALTTPSSSSPSISADGRWVAFRSTATNLVPGTNFSSGFVVLRDRELGTTIGVTDPEYLDDTRPIQSQRRGQGSAPSISADGSVVAFVSTDGAFVDDDTNTWPDLFVWTRATGAYERISLTSAGQQLSGSADYSDPRLSADGQLVAFTSSRELVPDNTVTGTKVFLRDRTNQTTELISLDAADAAVSAHSPSISNDGRHVAFVTSASLVAEDTNGMADVYLRDRTDGTIEFCSRKPDGGLFAGNAKSPALSGDARYLAFVAPGQSVDDGFTLLHDDLFVLDRQTGAVVEAGVGIDGEALGFCRLPSLSTDGRFLAFESGAANLVEDDTNGLTDIFLRDRAAELAEAPSPLAASNNRIVHFSAVAETSVVEGAGLAAGVRFESAMTAAGLSGNETGPLATPFHDGVENLLKFAFHMNLNAADTRVLAAGGTAGLPRITLEGSGVSRVLRYEFVRRTDFAGLSYTPQKLMSPSAEIWLPLGVSPVHTPIDATWERVIYNEPAPAGTAPRLFGRIEVTFR